MGTRQVRGLYQGGADGHEGGVRGEARHAGRHVSQRRLHPVQGTAQQLASVPSGAPTVPILAPSSPSRRVRRARSNGSVPLAPGPAASNRQSPWVPARARGAGAAAA